MHKAHVKALEKQVWSGKKVLLRADYDVILARNPVSNELDIVHDRQVKESAKTIRHLVESGAKVVIIAHLGDPLGKSSSQYSLRPIGAKLVELLDGISFTFWGDCVGEEAEEAKASLDQGGQVVLLENLRFHMEEYGNSGFFAKALAEGMDVYVNDAFAICHEAHASVHGIAQYFEQRYAGPNLHHELVRLQTVVNRPQHPIAVLLGGESDRIKVSALLRLLDKVDKILVGGDLVCTFYRALDHGTGNTVADYGSVLIAKEVLEKASDMAVVLRIAADCKVVELLPTKMTEDFKIVRFDAFPSLHNFIDIGPEAVMDFSVEMQSSKTILFCGLMGTFDHPSAMNGTRDLLKITEKCTLENCQTILCGPAIAAAAASFECKDFYHISFGCAAVLDLVAGKELPGIVVLSDE